MSRQEPGEVTDSYTNLTAEEDSWVCDLSWRGKNPVNKLIYLKL